MRLDANITDPDGFYASLIAANEDLTEAEANDFVIRLMLIMANQIGDQSVLERCVQQALGSPKRSKKVTGVAEVLGSTHDTTEQKGLPSGCYFG